MTEKRKITFILNPKSGTTSKAEVPALIEQILNKDLFSTEICFTEYRGHAAEIAKAKAKEGVDIVVAVGGDGTVNEVARSLVHTDTALAIVPCGSGNGLARVSGEQIWIALNAYTKRTGQGEIVTWKD